MSDAVLLSVPLGGGLDETTDDVFTPPTSMRVARNVVYPDANTCAKRNGVTALASLANLKRLAKHGDEVLAIDGLNAWSWSPTANALAPRGPVPPCVVHQRAIGGSSPIATGTISSAADIYYNVPVGALAEGNGFRIAVWTDNVSMFASVYDLANGSFVRPQETLNAAALSQPRCFVLGTTAYALYYVIATGLLVARTLDLTNVTAGWSAATTLATYTPTTNVIFDASPVTGASTFALLVWGGGVLTGFIFSSALAVVASNNSFFTPAGAFVRCVAVRATQADNLFMWAVGDLNSAGTQSQVQIGNTDLSFSVKLGQMVFAAPSNQAFGISSITLERKYESGSGTTSVYFLAYSYRFTETGTFATQSRAATDTWLVIGNTGSGRSLDTTFAQQIMSKIFCVSVNGSNQYFWLSMGSDATRPPTSILYRYAGDAFVGQVPIWLPVATITPDYAAPATGLSTQIGFPQSFAQDVTYAGNTAQSVYTIVGTFVAQANSVALGAFEIDFASPQLWQSVELGRCAYLACGTPMTYDGSTLTECGFTHAPPQPSATVTSGGGQVPLGPPTGGTQQPTMIYVLCYAQQDALGNVHRSAASAPLELVMTGTAGEVGTVALYVPPYKATYRQPTATIGAAAVHPVTIEVYRNTVASGGVFQLLAVVENPPTNTLITITDELADSAIVTNPALDTQQGLVPAVGWPSLTGLCVHSDRILGFDADGITQYYSTPLEAGTAPRMADQFTITWPEGPLTASWSLEGRLHAATARKIHFIYGDGPNDNGASSDFSQPQIWQSDLGVVDARGVCILTVGVLFLSEKGIYLESRAGDYTWIGQRVRRTLAANGNAVTSMTALDVFGVVRITLGGAAGATTVLHYDYRHDRWSTLVYPEPMFSSAIAAGSWFGLGTPSGGTPTLYQEVSGTWLDGGAWIPVTLSTGWALPGEGMQGWGEVTQAQVLMQRQSSYALTVSFTKDYYPSAEANPIVWASGALDTITTIPTVQLRATVPVQNAEALSVTLNDAAPTGTIGTGQGAIFQHLQIAMRAKRGEFVNLDGVAVQ